MTDIDSLAARVGEDEQIGGAAAVRSPEWFSDGHGVIGSPFWNPDPDDPDERLRGETIVYDEGKPYFDEAIHIARHDPKRIAAEVALKRLILTDHQPVKLDGKQYCVGCDPANLTAWWESCPYIKALEAIYTEGSAS